MSGNKKIILLTIDYKRLSKEVKQFLMNYKLKVDTPMYIHEFVKDFQTENEEEDSSEYFEFADDLCKTNDDYALILNWLFINKINYRITYDEYITYDS